MSATWTSGEPVSPLWVALSVMTAFFLSGVTAISTPKGFNKSGWDHTSRRGRLQEKAFPRLSPPTPLRGAQGEVESEEESGREDYFWGGLLPAKCFCQLIQSSVCAARLLGSHKGFLPSSPLHFPPLLSTP